jgi:hypothetical protein
MTAQINASDRPAKPCFRPTELRKQCKCHCSKRPSPATVIAAQPLAIAGLIAYVTSAANGEQTISLIDPQNLAMQ